VSFFTFSSKAQSESNRMVRLWPLGLALGLGALALWLLPPAPEEPLSPLAALGREIFHDPSLSASGQQSCASCHRAEFGHASAHGIEKGGPAMQATGQRNVPSIRYLQTRHALNFDNEGKASGGFFWDGRAASLETQAAEPFLNPVEMANRDAEAVVKKLSQATYAKQFAALNGQTIWQHPGQAFAAMTQALAAYQREDPDLQRFDSRFDRVMQGRARFTPAEERGWALFKDTEKGNCAACHTAEASADGTPPLFTDHSYDNLGVPRLSGLPIAARDTDHDLGLCNTKQIAARSNKSELCGAFKVPSLRNVAVRQAFFHNASFTDLRDVIVFYATRDTDAKHWYGAGPAFNDVPAKYRRNVNRSEVPYGQKPGETPRLNEQDIDDLLAFLHALTDADLAKSIAKPQGVSAAPSAAVRADRQVASPVALNNR
jgi:cytochrome c peroxidase